IYIVMQLVRGGSLDDRLRKGPLSLNGASRMLSQIASALTFAHEQGIVHRDLKPNNVLLDEKDNAYLTDFGIAKMLAGTSKLTATGNILGTPAYMAPEQWRGEPVDARTDIYSLGVMLYEMVLGRLPFSGETPYTLMYKHFNDAPPPPRELNPNLNPAIEAVILRALSKDKDARFQSGDEMAEAFDNAVRGLPQTARQTPASLVMDKTLIGDEVPAGYARTPTPGGMAMGTQMPTMPPVSSTGMTPPGAYTPTPAAVMPAKRGLSPVVIGIVALVALAIIGGGAFVLFGGGDDDKDEGTKVAQATDTAEPSITPSPEPSEEPSATATERLTMAVILTEQSTVRSGPGSDYATLGVLPRDEEVVINAISENGEWYQIVFQGDLGWIWGETVRITGNPNIPVKPWPTATQVPTNTPEPTSTNTPEPTPTNTPEPTNTPQPPSPTPPEVSAVTDPEIFVPAEFQTVELEGKNVTLDYPTTWQTPTRIGVMFTMFPLLSGDQSSSLYPQMIVARGTPQELQSGGMTSDITNSLTAVEHTLGADFTGLAEPVSNFAYPAYQIDQVAADSHTWIWLIEVSGEDWLSIVALAPAGEYDDEFATSVLDRMLNSMQIDGNPMVISADSTLLNTIPVELGTPVLDRFDDNTNDWRFGSVVGGEVMLDAPEFDRVFWTFPATIEEGGPAYYFQVTGELRRVPTSWEYGVVFRVKDESNFYYYVINSSRQYTLFSVTDGTFNELVGQNYSDMIVTDGGARNTIGVLVLVDYIELYVNNQRVNTVVDHSQPTGNIRLAGYTFPDADQTIQVAFDDFAYLPLNILENDTLTTDRTATIVNVINPVDVRELPQADATVLTTVNSGATMAAFGRTPDNQYLMVYGNNTIGWAEASGLDLVVNGSAVTIESLPAVAPSLSGLLIQVWPVVWPDETTTTPAGDATPLPTVSLVYGGTVTGELSGIAESETWAFSGMKGDVVTIVTNAADDSPTLDVMASLYDETGMLLTSDDDSGTGVNALITAYTLPSNGIYTIEVYSISGSGSYSVELTKN
ncbi:MAG TPA: serine/threonine protein kinase, partial [Aggregatilineaceae bacterium]|nr:serine/threonine protein kinase [Aggregatilineaceae bacterium]